MSMHVRLGKHVFHAQASECTHLHARTGACVMRRASRVGMWCTSASNAYRRNRSCLQFTDCGTVLRGRPRDVGPRRLVLAVGLLHTDLAKSDPAAEVQRACAPLPMCTIALPGSTPLSVASTNDRRAQQRKRSLWSYDAPPRKCARAQRVCRCSRPHGAPPCSAMPIRSAGLSSLYERLSESRCACHACGAQACARVRECVHAGWRMRQPVRDEPTPERLPSPATRRWSKWEWPEWERPKWERLPSPATWLVFTPGTEVKYIWKESV